MKQIIAMLLVLVMCLAMCACGVDEQYKALIEYLDARDYEGAKAEMMALFPEAKAEAEILEKYGELIELLEKEDYEGALLDVQSRVPVPEYESIEITMDNWQEYFEIVPSHGWDENAFGEGEALHMGISMFIKDEYASRLSGSKNTKIACTVSFDARNVSLDINWKEKSYSETAYVQNPFGGNGSTVLDNGRYLLGSFEEDCSATAELNAAKLMSDNGFPNIFWYLNVQNQMDYIYNSYICENISMVRISGTLELLAE